MQDALIQLLDMLEPLGAQALALVEEPAQPWTLAWHECGPAHWAPLVSATHAVPRSGWLVQLTFGVDGTRVPHLFVATSRQAQPGDACVLLGSQLCRTWWRVQTLERAAPSLRTAVHTLRNGLNALSMCAQVLARGQLPDELTPFVGDLVVSLDHCVEALEEMRPLLGPSPPIVNAPNLRQLA